MIESLAVLAVTDPDDAMRVMVCNMQQAMVVMMLRSAEEQMEEGMGRLKEEWRKALMDSVEVG